MSRAAKPRPNALTVHSRSAMEAPRSRRMVLSGVATTSWSRATISPATAVSASTQRRAGGLPVAADAVIEIPSGRDVTGTDSATVPNASLGPDVSLDLDASLDPDAPNRASGTDAFRARRKSNRYEPD